MPSLSFFNEQTFAFLSVNRYDILLIMLPQFHLMICDALDEPIKFDVQCWILCTYSALQISFFEVICSSVFLPWINMTKSGTLSLSFTLLFLKSITLFLNGSCRMFFHSAISTNITWPNEHLSNVNTITFIQEKLSSIMA